LTTITTMAGLAPMMFGLSLDFFGGGYSVDSPTALWWKQLATAVVFGLGIATVLTLLFTPSMLAIRVWFSTYAIWIARALAALSFGRGSRAAMDWALKRQARRVRKPELIWDDYFDVEDPVASTAVSEVTEELGPEAEETTTSAPLEAANVPASPTVDVAETAGQAPDNAGDLHETHESEAEAIALNEPDEKPKSSAAPLRAAE
jgi:hypothetical protein